MSATILPGSCHLPLPNLHDVFNALPTVANTVTSCWVNWVKRNHSMVLISQKTKLKASIKKWASEPHFTENEMFFPFNGNGKRMKMYAVIIAVVCFYFLYMLAPYSSGSKVASLAGHNVALLIELKAVPAQELLEEGRMVMQMYSNVIIMYQYCHSAWRAQYIVQRVCGWMLK